MLQTHMVRYEEKDLFMSKENQKELMERLNTNKIVLPQVFADGASLGVNISLSLSLSLSLSDFYWNFLSKGHCAFWLPTDGKICFSECLSETTSYFLLLRFCNYFILQTLESLEHLNETGELRHILANFTVSIYKWLCRVTMQEIHANNQYTYLIAIYVFKK